jgi:hypothetical protein
MREMMKNLVRTSTVIASIAVAVVLLLMAPKGFEMSAPDPIVAGPADTLAKNIDGPDVGRPGQVGGGSLAGLAGILAGLAG